MLRLMVVLFILPSTSVMVAVKMALATNSLLSSLLVKPKFRTCSKVYSVPLTLMMES